MRFRITYTRVADLQRDIDAQLSRGGMFFMVEAPEELAREARVAVEIVAPDGASLAWEGDLLALVPGQGLAVSVLPEHVERLRRSLLCGDAREASPPRHERVEATTPGRATRAVRSAPVDALAEYDTLSPADKMRLAQHGNKDERAAVLRDKNRSLHVHVLKNPKISVEEVAAIARNPQQAPDLLKLIAEKLEWFTRSTVAEALARNPKTPGDLGVRALAHCSQEAVRQIAKGSGAPPLVIQAARKRVIGT